MRNRSQAHAPLFFFLYAHAHCLEAASAHSPGWRLAALLGCVRHRCLAGAPTPTSLSAQRAGARTVARMRMVRGQGKASATRLRLLCRWALGAFVEASERVRLAPAAPAQCRGAPQGRLKRFPLRRRHFVVRGPRFKKIITNPKKHTHANPLTRFCVKWATEPGSLEWRRLCRV